MKKIKVLISMILMTVSAVAFAQNITVKGQVTDASTGEGLPGAAILVKGGSEGVVADLDGNYSITVAKDATLGFTTIGFKSVEIEVQGRTTINVALESDHELLDEVVVTAQGLTRKQKAIGYSAQKLGADDITVTHATDMANSLAGKVAGAQFWGKAGSTFDEGYIVLRGATSYSDAQGNAPIYVIDGTIASASAINMEDVESINVLKGPAATALYGSRGANGAVIVTTKRATEGRSVIEFSQTTSVESAYDHMKFNNLYGGGSYAASVTALANEYGAGAYDYTSAPFLYGTLGTLDDDYEVMDLGDGTYYMDYYSDENWGARYDDKIKMRPAISWFETSPKYGKAEPWQANLKLKDLTRNAWTSTTNVAFSKSVKDFSTRVAFTNVNRQGVLYNSEAVRRSFSIVSTFKPAKWLNADVSYRYRLRKNKNGATEGYSAEGNTICDFTQWGQTNVNIRDYFNYMQPDGTWSTWNIMDPSDLTANFHDNPFGTMYNYNRFSTTHYHLISSDVYATLPQNIKLGVRVNNSITASQSENKYATGSINWSDYFATSHAQTSDFTIQEYVTWGDQFVEDRLSVEAALFAEQRAYDYTTLSSNTNGGLSIPEFYNLKASNSTYSTSNSETHYKTRSFFGTATIGWDDLVYLDGSIRYDIDSRLPDANNAYLYGGGSLSFMASKLIDADWLDFWKIRGSIAQVGSTISAYNVHPTYSVGTKTHNLPAMAQPTNLLNPNIKPTISTSYEIGTEFKMFKNRFYGDINFYRKNTRDNIISADVLAQAGYNSRTLNAGLVRNQGIEIMLGGTPVSTKDWTWSINANWAKNNNMLVDLSDPTVDDEMYTIYWTKFYDEFYQKAIEGYPIGVISSGSRALRNDKGQMILQKGNSAWGDVRPVYERGVEKIVGNVQPKFTGGLSTNLRYKNLTLSASLDYVVGGQIFSWTNMWGTGSGLLASTTKINKNGVNEREPVACGGGVWLEGVDKDGNPMSGFADAYNYYHNEAYYDNDSWLFDRTYVKLREISLRYDLPKKFVNNLGIGLSQASIAFIANNPWLIYSACPNLDPSEVSGADYYYLEGGQAMSTRSFGLSINVTF